jgi:DNA-binding NarL/FixJ family response regulator
MPFADRFVAVYNGLETANKLVAMEPTLSSETQQERATVLIADDHTLVAQGLSSLIEKDFNVLGIVESGAELLRVAAIQAPDVALIDVSMPEMTGLEAARKLLAIAPKCKVIFVSMHATPEFVREAFGIGARGYLLKRSASSELVHAIRTVLKGNTTSVCRSPATFSPPSSSPALLHSRTANVKYCVSFQRDDRPKKSPSA